MLQTLGHVLKLITSISTRMNLLQSAKDLKFRSLTTIVIKLGVEKKNPVGWGLQLFRKGYVGMGKTFCTCFEL